MVGQRKEQAGKTPLPGFLAWLLVLVAWLVCAGFCLLLTVELEGYPAAYELFFPAVLLILFGNILVFLFVASRWGKNLAALAASLARVCIGEGLLLAGMYLLGRFAFA